MSGQTMIGQPNKPRRQSRDIKIGDQRIWPHWPDDTSWVAYFSSAPVGGLEDLLTFLKLHDSGAAYSGHGEAFLMTCDDSERPQQPQQRS